MRRYVSIFLLVLMGLGVNQVKGQSSRLQDHPGYVDFDSIEDDLGVEANIQVSVKGALLKLVSAAARVEDEEFADLVNGLKAIRVTGFSADEYGHEVFDSARDLAKGFSDNLKRDWDQVAMVREKGENVYVYLRDIDDIIQGMVVMVVDDKDGEAIFVNIVGRIDPEQIGRIGQKFDVDVLEELGNLP